MITKILDRLKNLSWVADADADKSKLAVADPKPKKLIFLFDGTGNEPASAIEYLSNNSITNILKLHLLLGGNLSNNSSVIENQVTFYYRGVGTYGGWWQRLKNTWWPSRFGGDIERIVDDAIRDLKRHYIAGGDIYIFGFSRGAAIARIFAAKFRKITKIKGITIKFMGVFDTVLGTRGPLHYVHKIVPSIADLDEVGHVGGYIERVVHLVSIDEKRVTFRPTLFNKENKAIMEVWFAGVHADIGGGFWWDGASDVTLSFMIERAQQSGLEFIAAEAVDYEKCNKNKKDVAIYEDDVAIRPIVDGDIHKQAYSGFTADIRIVPRVIKVIENNMTAKADPNDKELSHLPIIHHTVQDKFNLVKYYRPYALRSLAYRIMDKNGKITKENGKVKVFQGVSDLLESVINS